MLKYMKMLISFFHILLCLVMPHFLIYLFIPLYIPTFIFLFLNRFIFYGTHMTPYS